MNTNIVAIRHFILCAFLCAPALGSAQQCAHMLGRFGCEPCQYNASAYQADGIPACISCPGQCSNWSSKADIAVGSASKEKIDKAALADAAAKGEQQRFESNFVQLSDVYSVAQVNPVAAIVLLRFLPTHYQPTRFYDGDGTFQQAPTIETVNALVNKQPDEMALKTMRTLPEGSQIQARWLFSQKSKSEQAFWTIETYTKAADEGYLGKPFPTIEFTLTPSAPYRVVSWIQK